MTVSEIDDLSRTTFHHPTGPVIINRNIMYANGEVSEMRKSQLVHQDDFDTQPGSGDTSGDSSGAPGDSGDSGAPSFIGPRFNKNAYSDGLENRDSTTTQADDSMKLRIFLQMIFLWSFAKFCYFIR